MGPYPVMYSVLLHRQSEQHLAAGWSAVLSGLCYHTVSFMWRSLGPLSCFD
jgi:hypothetical protein